MPLKFLKWLRIGIAAAMLAGLTAAFVDFRGMVPWQIGHTLAEIQFVPSLVALITGASLSLACIIVAVVTLTAGRIYCSAICPLGIYQDVIHRLSNWLKHKSKPKLYSRPHTWLRQTILWGTIAAAVAGFGGFALSLVDPYSNFGRIASDIFRPLITMANNAMAGPAGKLGWPGLFRVPPHWASFAALHQPLILLVLLIALVALGGRLYCNTLCPVGTLLGWLAQRAAFRLQIDRSACRKCARCLRVCKAHCIDLRAGAIDFSRCVACYNCVDACNEHGINYRFAWSRRKTVSDSTPPIASDGAIDPQRRAFLAQAILAIIGTAKIPGWGETPGAPRSSSAETGSGGHLPRQSEGHRKEDFSPAICPPGAASVDRFLDRCTACHLCISECPTGVLQPSFVEYGFIGIMKPRMDYRAAFCNYDCRRCGEVCPDGAIDLLEPAAKHLTKIGEAHFDRDKCVVVTNGTDCAACSEHCPTKAVSTIPHGNNLRLPSLNKELCIGCGACEYACPAKPEKAIKASGLRKHGWAKKNIEPKATLPKASGDFPF